MSDDQRAVIAFLSSPLAYDLTNTNVERCETHGAIVFLADNYAYKLKRAVIFPYMDYSTSTRRRAMCEAELAVNRALAPEIYIEVRPVTRDAAGAFRIGKPGEAAGAVDWLVVMRRFDQDALFDNLCRHSAITGDLVRLLARRIASFHQGAEINTRHGGVRGISAVIDECVKIFREMEGAPFEGPRIEIFANLARAALVRCYDYLESRRKDGHVRRCHGDLHLGNICLIHGEPVPFDAIEFDDEFSCIDVLYDLAFLLMDLEQRDLAVEANALLNHYLARTGDYRGLDALPVFLACRAAIRAHVTIAAAKLKDGQISPTQTRNASQLLELSIRYLEPVAVELIAVGGLSGTGKSNLAIALAPRIGRRPGAILVRTDALRKNLWAPRKVKGCRRLPIPSNLAKKYMVRSTNAAH
jgi:aminoglycoside phosphotransferase family enzyme